MGKRRGRLGRKKLERLYAALGVRPDDAAAAIESELDEDFPQLAAAVVCLTLWHHVDLWRDDPSWVSRLAAAPPEEPGSDVVRKALAAGLTEHELGELARSVAASHTFDVLHRIEDGYSYVLQERHDLELPGWALVELDRKSRPTGRGLDGLYENFFGWEPGAVRP